MSTEGKAKQLQSDALEGVEELRDDITSLRERMQYYSLEPTKDEWIRKLDGFAERLEAILEHCVLPLYHAIDDLELRGQGKENRHLIETAKLALELSKMNMEDPLVRIRMICLFGQISAIAGIGLEKADAHAKMP